ncbi:hypothetical protein SEA_DMITRI_34 [Gordonia phage Dmitri]|nr:hypothetical protein SEA_DMITRI_34 [Gordonia phage Dmitri]
MTEMMSPYLEQIVAGADELMTYYRSNRGPLESSTLSVTEGALVLNELASLAQAANIATAELEDAQVGLGQPIADRIQTMATATRSRAGVSYSDGEIIDALWAVNRHLVGVIARTQGSAGSEFIARFESVKHRIDKHDIQQLVPELQTLLVDVQEAEKAAREATSHVANIKLAEAVTAFCSREKRNAMWWRMATVLATLAALGVGWLVGLPETVPESIQHTATIAIVLGLAGYCARQASRHASAAGWAEVTGIQLQTFDDFVKSVSSVQVQDDIRRQFALHAYGPSGSTENRAAADAEIGALQQLLGALSPTK